MDEFFNINDVYHIRQDWKELKKICELFEIEITKFLGHTKNKKASIRARKKLLEIRLLTKQISKKIIKTRQDYNSDYS